MVRTLLVAFLGVFFAASALAGDAERNLIYVNGQGEIEAEPDVAYVAVGVTTLEPTAAATYAANNQISSRINEAVRTLGIDRKDLRTVRFSLTAQYDYTAKGGRVFRGYQMNHTLLVKVRDLKKLGAVLDKANQAGATDMGGVTFAIDDPTPLETQARERAVKAAVAKAQQLAAAAGVRLGKIASISESQYRPPLPQMDYALRAAAPEASPGAEVEAGTMKVSITVSMTYEIEQ